MTVGVSDQGVHGSQLMRNSGRGRQHVGLAKPANDARIAQKLMLFRMEVDSDAESRDTHSRATSKAKGKSKPTNGKSRGAALVCNPLSRCSVLTCNFSLMKHPRTTKQTKRKRSYRKRSLEPLPLRRAPRERQPRSLQRLQRQHRSKGNSRETFDRLRPQLILHFRFSKGRTSKAKPVSQSFDHCVHADDHPDRAVG